MFGVSGKCSDLDREPSDQVIIQGIRFSPDFGELNDSDLVAALKQVGGFYQKLEVDEKIMIRTKNKDQIRKLLSPALKLNLITGSGNW
jgi:hypothetical protein